MLSSRGPANLHDDPEPAELDELELDGQLGRAMLRHLNGHDSLLCVARELSVPRLYRLYLGIADGMTIAPVWA